MTPVSPQRQHESLRRIVQVPFLLLIASCADDLYAPLPIEGALSAVVRVETEPVMAHALDLAEPAVFVGPRNAQLRLHTYGVPLESLGLAPGPIALGGPVTRPLPEPDAAFVSEHSGSRIEWTAVDPEPIVVARPSALECAEAGGCYADVDGADLLTCIMPCPVDVEAPTILPPDPPNPPVQSFAPPARIGCAASDVQWVDGSDCEELDPCAAGMFRPGLPSGAIQIGPTDDFEAALAAASGGVLALARGTYTSTSQNVASNVEIVGTCASETTIDIASERLRFQGESSVVGVTVNVDVFNGLWLDPGGDLTVEDARLVGGTVSYAPAVAVRSEKVTLNRVVLEGPLGPTLTARSGAVISLNRVVVRGQGLVESVPTEFTAVDTVMDVGSNPWIALSLGGTGRLERVYITGAETALQTFRADVVAEGMMVTNVGRAVVLNQSSTIDITDARFEGLRTEGIEGFGSELSATDLVVRNAGRAGIRMTNGMVTLERVEVFDTVGFGIRLAGSPSTLTDVRVRGVFDDLNFDGELSSIGIVVTGEESTFERVATEGAINGLHVSMGNVTGTNLTVEGARGSGVTLLVNGGLQMNRAVISDPGLDAIYMEESALMLSNGVLDGGKVAIESLATSNIRLETVEIRDAKTLGLCLRGTTRLFATDLWIHDIHATESAPCFVTNAPAGTGVLVAEEPSLNLQRFLVERVDAAGFDLNLQASVTLAMGRIADSMTGMRLDPALPLSPVLTLVKLEGNDVAIEQ